MRALNSRPGRSGPGALAGYLAGEPAQNSNPRPGRPALAPAERRHGRGARLPAADFAAARRHWPGAAADFFEGRMDGSPPPGFPFPPAGKGEAGKAHAKGSGRGHSCLAFFLRLGGADFFCWVFLLRRLKFWVFPEMVCGFWRLQGGLALEEKAAANPFFSD